MDKPRPCGCKGCRTCLICEEKYDLNTKNFQLNQDRGYVYCPFCNRAWPGWDLNSYKLHPDHQGAPISYPGVYINLNFLNSKEEEELIEKIESKTWSLSQSGRRKQNFGPKCNFKKNKLKEGSFNGFPTFTKFIEDKFKDLEILRGFKTIEECFLEYDPKRGASIDPHIDDCWIWGERIVTVNLLADSVLTMTYNKNCDRYNLDFVSKYPSVLDSEGKFNTSGGCYRIQKYNHEEMYPIVRIPMPRRSLLVLFHSARYDWEHQVLREDIKERRICIAYREFTPPYLLGGDNYFEGEKILNKAKNYWDS